MTQHEATLLFKIIFLYALSVITLAAFFSLLKRENFSIVQNMVQKIGFPRLFFFSLFSFCFLFATSILFELNKWNNDISHTIKDVAIMIEGLTFTALLVWMIYKKYYLSHKA
jgi:hypothetical protein